MYDLLNNTAACCMALFSFFGNNTSFPGTAVYESSLASYFSLQAASMHPACIVSPGTVDDVASAVKILAGEPSKPSKGVKWPCRFAIRSGGHAPEADAANINAGVTLDLRRLNSFDVSADRSAVAVGVGNTWDAVYARLDTLNLTVNGGRTAGVGVGGLALGGGISYFGTRYGWTADTISNFQVVLANGSIVNANRNDNVDLHWALKGGGNNFGVVTRVDLEAYEQGPSWGGFLYYPNTVWKDTAREFVKFNSAENYDEYAALTLSWGYSSSLGTAVGCNMVYTKAVENPPVFDGFASLPTLFGTLQIAKMTELSQELRNQQVYGERQLWATATFVSTEAMVNATYIRFNESVPSFASIANITVGYTLEPLPPALYARHGDENPLGLQNRNSSLVIALFTASWTDAEDDGQVEIACRALMDAVNQDAERLGASDPFLYLNYAGRWQNPLDGYGWQNINRLREIAMEVDPNEVFTHQVPGGFKVRP